MEIPIKMDDFWGTTILGNTHKDPLEGMAPPTMDSNKPVGECYNF